MLTKIILKAKVTEHKIICPQRGRSWLDRDNEGRYSRDQSWVLRASETAWQGEWGDVMDIAHTVPIPWALRGSWGILPQPSRGHTELCHPSWDPNHRTPISLRVGLGRHRKPYKTHAQPLPHYDQQFQDHKHVISSMLSNAQSNPWAGIALILGYYPHSAHDERRSRCCWLANG